MSDEPVTLLKSKGGDDEDVEFGTQKVTEIVAFPDGDINVYTECCGCRSPLTAEELDGLVAAWQQYRKDSR